MLLSCRRLSQLLSQVLSRRPTSGRYLALKHQELDSLSTHNGKNTHVYMKCLIVAVGRVPPSGWVGMKTVAQLRREQGIGAPRNADSLYRDIERAPRKFNPLKIPKALQVIAQVDP